MKLIKKILRIIAIILPAYCIFFMPVSTYAKTYEIDSFSQHSYSVYTPNGTGDRLANLNLAPTIWVNDKTGIEPRRVAYLNSHYNAGHCIYQSGSFSNSVYTTTNSFTWGSSFIPDDSRFYSYIDDVDAKCRSFASYGASFGSSTVPQFLDSSVPFDQSINIASLRTKDTHILYNFMYSNLYFSSSRTVDGQVKIGKFYPSDLLNLGSNSIDTWSRDSDYKYYANRITRFSFPLNFNSTLEMTDTSHNIIISGFIYNNDMLHQNTPGVFIDSTFIDPSTYSPISSTTTCIVNTFPTAWAFACSIPVPISTYFYGFNFIVSGGAYDDYSTLILPGSHNTDSTELYVSFDAFTITINGDNTEGGNGGYRQLGSYPNVSPGTPEGENSTDWFTSLSDQFKFTVLNPFAPIFDLFTAGDRCVQIPTIAGMLHAPDDEYCPWFDATTRNIVTPVVAISSVMLVFGFVVRWLGSDSGNMFADGPNQRISIKGGK